MTRTGIVGTMASFGPAVQRLNAHLLSPQSLPSPTPKVAVMRKDGAQRIRQRRVGDGMNKWEREWHQRLVGEWDHVYREVSLPLANGLRYKVDFLCVDSTDVGMLVEGHEVKGHARSTGIAKVKMAARLYPWIVFWLVTKSKKEGWVREAVLP